MYVNELPARSYRWLQLNGLKLDIDNIKFDRFELSLAKAPEGITLNNMCSAKAELIFAASKEIIDVKDKNVVGPNGDTSKRHSGQMVRTGMGIDVDELFDGLNVETTVISVEKDSKITNPLVFNDKLAAGENLLSRQLIVVPDNSSLTVIMNYTSDENADGAHGISTKFYVGKNASLHLIKVQMLGKRVLHFDDIGGLVDDDGSFSLTQMELGAAKSVTGAYVTCFGNRSKSINNTGYLGKDNQFFDFNYVAEHRGMKTESLAVFRGVLDDNASKNWRGTLDFKENSKGSIGDEQEDTLLLSDDVINRSMPVILCKEEVVDGRHGATIGQLSDDMLFYMASRGIDKKKAQKIMVRARLDSISRLIGDMEIEGMIAGYLDHTL